MSEYINDNKRIAKNTLMLYIRMLLSVAVSLYTSRVILEILGIEDYGIYGVVGGVVAMFSFLNASMSGATSRFLAYEMGTGNSQQLKDTFSCALIIHIAIAFIVFLLAETIGLWFLCNKLVIPEGRMFAAHWVYQCSIISSMLTIIQVPYNSLIIAHERMEVYAYIEILNVVLKLLIVYALTIVDFDKLIIYAILVLTVSIIALFVYRIYCIRNFKESRFSILWNKDILRPMLSFTGWDFYGNLCVTARVQGTNFLINNFFGVIANAANGIATTVNSVISGFACNIITAFRPRIIKEYSQQKWEMMQSMIDNSIKFSILFLLMLSLPILFDTSFVIELWLGQVPEYVVPFIRLTLITNSIGIINSVIVIAVHATGNIKRLSYLTGTLYILALPVSYILLKLGCNVVSVYVVNLFSTMFIVAQNLWILKRQVKAISIVSIIRVIVISIIVSILSGICVWVFFINFEEGFLRLFIITLTDIISMLLFTYVIALSNSQREYVKNYLMRIINISNN